jgi:thiol-disulfide isomerase/thioredoxin
MGNNPNEEALKELYEKTSGSLDGYDDYLERVLAGDRETRRERILAERHENPETPPAFELSDIEGNSIDSGIMDGRVVAINFWGKWCGPCVAEMPDIQELYEKYMDDEDVLVLTINNDPILSELIEWMDEHEYTFPTLRDDGYIPTAGVSVFPTTWFLDRSGSIVYTQRGYTSELVEEFSWRIEELRSER